MERMNSESESKAGSESESGQRFELPKFGDELSDANEYLQAADRKVRQLVYEKPLYALGGALAFGYLLGRTIKS